MGIDLGESEPASVTGMAWLPASNLGRAILAALIVVGGSLRIHGFSDHGLWIDEYGTWWAVAGPSWADCWNRVLEIHGQSPLYYLIVRFSIDVLGANAASLRLPSLVFGIALLAIAYPFARRVFRDERIALLAVAAFALNDRLIYYSQEARPYSLALLLAVCSFHFYATLLDRDSRSARVWHVLATALTYYAHYFFGIVVLVQAVHLLATRPRRWRPWVATGVVLGVSLAPGLLQLRTVFARRDSLDWISEPTGWLSFLEPVGDLVAPVVFAATGVSALLGWAWHRPALRDALGAHGGIGICWFAVPVFIFSIIPQFVGINLAHARYLVVMAPAIPLLYAVLLAMPLGRPSNHAPGPIALLPTLVFGIATIAFRIVPFVSEQGDFWWFYQHGWDDAVHEIAEGFEPGDLILYRTHFVELDQVVRGEASAVTREFVEWPILAHLPAGRDFARRALPYSDNRQTREILRSTMHDASKARRIWLIGLEVDDPNGQRFILHRAIAIAMQHHGMKIVRRRDFGLVRMVLLRGPRLQPDRSG